MADMARNGGNGFKDLLFLRGSNLSRQVREQILMHTNRNVTSEFSGNEPLSLSSVKADCVPLAKNEVTLSSKKVCLICMCEPEGSICDEFHVYIVDLNNDSFDEQSSRAPAIRLTRECFHAETLCVSGTTLYMFELYDMDEDIDFESGKRVVTCQLPSSDIANWKLEKHDLVEVPSMLHRKDSPAAVPTPDGKILVVPSRVDLKYENNTSDLEIFDPEEQKWQLLPRLDLLLDQWSYKTEVYSCNIDAFTFINNGPTLLLETNIGLLTLEVKPPYDTKQWKRFGLERPCSLPDHGYSFIVIEDVLCLADWYSYEFGKAGFCWYPQHPVVDDDHMGGGRAIAPLGVMKNEEHFFCILHAQVHSGTMIPHLNLNVYSLDLIKYRKDKDKEGEGSTKEFLLPDISVVKSLNIQLSPMAEDWFLVCNLFTVPAS